MEALVFRTQQIDGQTAIETESGQEYEPTT